MKVAPDIRLTAKERQQLKEIISKGVSPARVQTRARILLLAAERSTSPRGRDTRKTNSNRFIAEMLQISEHTVSRVRQRFLEGGVERALYEHKRSGRPVEIDGEAEAHLFALACSQPPEGRDSWTLQLLADRMVELGYVEHISDTCVLERLKKQNFALGRSRVGASRK
jgi:transposase